MGKNIAQFDDRPNLSDEANISGLSTVAMFGNQVFERLRGFYDQHGRLRTRALDQHLSRLVQSLAVFNITVDDDLRMKWRQWIIAAAKASEYPEPYIHIGYGQFNSRNTTLQRQAGGRSTFIYVEEAPPLYGNGLAIVSQRKWPRPTGPLVHVKVAGNYANLVALRDQALLEQAPEPEEGIGTECVLFDETCFRPFVGSGKSGYRLLRDNDPLVVEFGCSNAISCKDGDLYLPGPEQQFFRGQSVQIIEELFRTMFPTNRVIYPLRLSHLQESGGAIGTATRDLVPVVSIDGVKTPPPNSTFLRLATAYAELCHGRSAYPVLQKKWAPVTK